MKKVYKKIKEFLNVKQHLKSAKAKYPQGMRIVQLYLAFIPVVVFLGTFFTTWLESDDPTQAPEAISWLLIALLPTVPILIWGLMCVVVVAMLVGFIVVFSPIWIPGFLWVYYSEKREKEAEEKQKARLLEEQIERSKAIGIERDKPENALWLNKSPGIYFDGHKIIIKSNYNAEIVKSIKGMQRRAWEPAIKAWICPIDEYPNVLGISKRFNLKLDETFANIDKSTDMFVDASIPGSNAHMLKLHNDGVFHLSPRKILKSNEGYVYIIRATDGSGLYKIGKSTNPDKRIKTVIGQMPMACEALHCAWFEDHGYAEKLLHDTYSDQRASSEWFNLSDEDITFILSLGQRYDLNPTLEQISERREMEQKRRDNYREFKDRENRRTNRNSRSNRNRHNPNRW